MGDPIYQILPQSVHPIVIILQGPGIGEASIACAVGSKVVASGDGALACSRVSKARSREFYDSLPRMLDIYEDTLE